MKNKYNAFLSHNSQDKPIVEQIAQWLEDKANLSVWLDKWNLIPGDPWQEEIENALNESRCCVKKGYLVVKFCHFLAKIF